MVIGPETRHHFISECSVFDIERQEFVNKLQNSRVLGCELDRYSRSPELFTQLVLDAIVILKVEERQPGILDTIELLSREYLHQIHQRRIAKLKLLSQP